MEKITGKINIQSIKVPPPNKPTIFMSANWNTEEHMYQLFVKGLEAGVRAFDTAREYKVEKMTGRALRKALKTTGVGREEIFVQTRISNNEIINGNLRCEICRSVDNLDMGYLDCFMFHWPTPNWYIPKWRELVEYYHSSDTLRFIGLCNCRIRHLEKMEYDGVDMMPHFVQVEVQPFWQVKPLKEYCDSRGIGVQAFSPLCKMIPQIRENTTLRTLAEKYNVSIAQIILKWHVQRGIAPISLTSKLERVSQNFNLSGFEISEQDMLRISDMDCGYKYHLESASCIGF